MTAINRTVNPTTQEPVSVDELKTQERITFSQEDTLLETFITASREKCEDYLGQSFVTQTWEAAFDRWPCATNQNPLAALYLPRPPLQSVSSVVYTNANNTSTTMASSDYQVDTKSKPGRVAMVPNQYWPTLMHSKLNPIVVTYVAGYGGSTSSAYQSAASVPMPIKQGILLFAAEMYRKRDEDLQMPPTVMRLLDLSSFGSYRYEAPDQY